MTGKRGPVTGATFGLPTGRPTRSTAKATSRQLEPVVHDVEWPVPMSLGERGRVVWRECQRLAVLVEDLDRAGLERFARMHDEAAELLHLIASLGPLLEEPIVTPTGAVVGTRVVANPAVKMLRDLDKATDQLGSSLGLSPAARARLGVAGAQIDRHRAAAATLLAELGARDA